MNEPTAAVLVLFAVQLGLLFLIAKFCGYIGKKSGVPQFICELLAGMIIGPYALGGIALPGLPNGFFELNNELYVFALIALVIFFFVFGLETNVGLFFRYSLAGSIIGFIGAILSFVAGNVAGCLVFNAAFFSVEGLFLGILFLATSSCLSAKILSKNKKMNSPEGIAVLTSIIFDNLLGIFVFALALAAGIIMFTVGLNVTTGTAVLLQVTAKIFGVLLGAIILGFVLSGYNIAAVIQKRIRGVYNFFIPLLFIILGMMVNVKELFTFGVLIPGVVISLIAVVAKLAGCGISSMLLGFNFRGSLRIASGMIPRGEFVIVIAGMGLALGIISGQVFGAVIVMVVITNVIAAFVLYNSLKLAGPGTRRPVKGDDEVFAAWDFPFPEIVRLVFDLLVKELTNEGFYIHRMNRQDICIQARKSDAALSVTQEKNTLTIETSRTDMPHIKNAVYKIINSLQQSIQKMNGSFDARVAGKMNDGNSSGNDIFSQISSECISVNLRGSTKEEVIAELVDILENQRRLLNRDLVLHDILEREKIMSTGMQKGIALPHAKTDGVSDLVIAIGIKKDGVEFGSIDGKKARLFIMVVSSRKTSGPHVQFLASISAVLKNDTLREAVINAETAEDVLRLLSKEALH